MCNQSLAFKPERGRLVGGGGGELLPTGIREIVYNLRRQRAGTCKGND